MPLGRAALPTPWLQEGACLAPGAGLPTLAPLCPQASIFAVLVFLFVGPEVLACLLMTPRPPRQKAGTRTPCRQDPPAKLDSSWLHQLPAAPDPGQEADPSELHVLGF